MPPHIAIGGQDARSNEPPAWPVLARFPHVGRQAASVDRAPTFSEVEHLPVISDGERLAAPAHWADATRAAAAEPSPALTYDWPEFDRKPVAEAPGRSAKREYLRIDAASALGDRRERLAPRAPEAMAARVFQWHAAFGPHAGVAATVALILSATLLYWLTLGQPGGALDQQDLPGQPTVWSSETTAGAPPAVAEPPVVAPDHTADLAPAQEPIPRIAQANPPQSDDDATASATPQEAPETVTTPEPKDDEQNTVSEAKPATTVDETDSSITPTPTTAPYPVTDYPEFEFPTTPTAATADAPTNAAAEQ
jgi:hypothetical protein